MFNSQFINSVLKINPEESINSTINHIVPMEQTHSRIEEYKNKVPGTPKRMLEESKQSDFNDPDLSNGVKMAEHHLLELCE